MTHHEEEHKTIAEFFEEYWPLLFFGLFFAMTMFLPLLFLENRMWFYGGLAIAMVLTVLLFILLAVLEVKKA